MMHLLNMSCVCYWVALTSLTGPAVLLRDDCRTDDPEIYLRTDEPDCWWILTSSLSIRSVCKTAWRGVFMLLLLFSNHFLKRLLN
jgi:hypothetical protein